MSSENSNKNAGQESESTPSHHLQSDRLPFKAFIGEFKNCSEGWNVPTRINSLIQQEFKDIANENSTQISSLINHILYQWAVNYKEEIIEARKLRAKRKGII